MMTIGEFARATRLSAKALRRYDELDLVNPAMVDPRNGYRYYSDEQIEQVRLIVWLRRIGMPIATIRGVLAASDPATVLRQYWQQVETSVVSNRRLVDFLVDFFDGRTHAMTFTLRYASSCTQGARAEDLDRALISDSVLAVADGFGGEGTGDEVIACLGAPTADTDIMSALNSVFAHARQASASHPDGEGTTLTALLRVGDQLGLVHIGDTRAYQLRAGLLRQITVDHTWVQSLVERGKLSAAEALTHPDRSLLTRALTAGHDTQAQLEVLDAQPGDRYLLCSDGVYGAIDDAQLQHIVRTTVEPARACAALIEAAGGDEAADNGVVVVCDVGP